MSYSDRAFHGHAQAVLDRELRRARKQLARLPEERRPAVEDVTAVAKADQPWHPLQVGLERAAVDRTWAFGHVIVDEAQQMSVESLEQIRILSNLETATRKLLQVLLVGQPELNWRSPAVEEIYMGIAADA